jgi:hypothetical protein
MNPRVLSNMGLAIPRPTRLGDPRPKAKDSNSHYINGRQINRKLNVWIYMHRYEQLDDIRKFIIF